jgi:hypothetical protein
MSDSELEAMKEHLSLVFDPFSRSFEELKVIVTKLHKKVHRIEVRQAEMKASYTLNKWLLSLVVAQFILMVIGVAKAY